MEVERKSARGRRGMAQKLPRKDLMRGDMVNQVFENLLEKDAVVEERMYDLPIRVPQLYVNQTQPLTQLKAFDVYRAVQNGFHFNESSKPFEKVLEKLETGGRLGSVGGPFKHPTEPLWIEMGQNLQKVLKKVGRRMRRRRRRKLQSKLFRSRMPPRHPGRELRAFLDKPMEPGIGPYLEQAIWGRS